MQKATMIAPYGYRQLHMMTMTTRMHVHTHGAQTHTRTHTQKAQVCKLRADVGHEKDWA